MLLSLQALQALQQRMRGGGYADPSLAGAAVNCTPRQAGHSGFRVRATSPGLMERASLTNMLPRDAVSRNLTQELSTACV